MDSHPTFLSPPLPPPAAASHSGESPFIPIIAVLAFVGAVVLLYAFFFVIKCPPNPLDWLRRSSGRQAAAASGPALIHHRNNTDQLVSVVAYKKAAVAGNDTGSDGGGECPVCLTVFVDGEEIREVNECKHLFHAACIDMWLCSHSNCPVCRASIGPKRSKPPPVVAGEGDFQQGLPDSASMV